MLFEVPKPTAGLWFRALLSGEKCILCGENTAKGLDLFCPDCRERLNREAESICPRCGAQAADCLCAPTTMRRAGVFRFVKLFPYEAGANRTADKILFRLKSRKDRLLCRRIADLWAERVLPLLMTDGVNAADVGVAYVPRSRRKKRETGTDQAEELARALAKRIGCDLFRGLIRTRDGQAQKSLHRADRGENAGTLFSCDDCSCETVLLVDDLVTTGETVAACARLLQRAGAKKVISLSVAHTVGGEVDYLRFEGTPADPA